MLSKDAPKTIRAARLRARLTPDALASKVKVSPETIRRIERGNTTPREATLFRICDALQLDIAELIADAESPAAKAAS